MLRVTKLIIPVATTLVSVGFFAPPAAPARWSDPRSSWTRRPSIRPLPVRRQGPSPRLVQGRRALRRHRLPVQGDRQARRRRTVSFSGKGTRLTQRNEPSRPSSRTTTTGRGRPRSVVLSISTPPRVAGSYCYSPVSGCGQSPTKPSFLGHGPNPNSDFDAFCAAFG